MANEVDWSSVPGQPSPAGDHFKWGWNGRTREATVWRVDGADGPPVHNEHLTEAWGRPPSSSAGDGLGVAEATRSQADDEEAPTEHFVYITPFYGKPVPQSVIDWFRTALPDHTVR